MMRAALALARRSLGRTWPNPAVGCVIVRDGRIIARGRTGEGGRPHAEANALASAIEPVDGATVYVTLEPCAHHGRTPPCADALVSAGVSQVVSAIEDPDPRVRGEGHARLKTAGIAVDVGEGAAEAAEINAGFFRRVKDGRPLFHLKLATSLDGAIATSAGESRWITGVEARAAGHRLRATHDGILVGANTVATDDPELTCRLPGLAARSPIRIVLDSRGRLPLRSRLVATAHKSPVWLICTEADRDHELRLVDQGVKVIRVQPAVDGRVDPLAAAQALGNEGLTRVLIEGGSEVAAAFLKGQLIDRITHFRAGVVMGADSRSAVGPLGIDRLDFAPRFSLVSARIVGQDTVESWRRGA
ncbi:MAG TPA: bifunctional diaminohydroxyphosphoribosylaminopyrimidine deaminase/5-amino-6-(5-phosphoribosylamino)uracil reductase RibD [Reyranella sp.]|nr:bifunctional diaminohydroxyphosphoribosylaminopyrimidine deaminase/5-amino-6-(5-phosphoribosylamino)uracil reductase RibD [Reyranella sp.]